MNLKNVLHEQGIGSHPGPQTNSDNTTHIRLDFINVTSLAKQRQQLVSRKADVICICEHSTHSTQHGRMKNFFKSNGFNDIDLSCTDPGTTRTTGGVGIITRNTVGLTKPPHLTQDFKDLAETGRVAIYELDTYPLIFRLAIVYGWTNNDVYINK